MIEVLTAVGLDAWAGLALLLALSWACFSTAHRIELHRDRRPMNFPATKRTGDNYRAAAAALKEKK